MFVVVILTIKWKEKKYYIDNFEDLCYSDNRNIKNTDLTNSA